MQRNILIADDHTIIRNGLTMMVQMTLGHPNVKAVGSCAEVQKELEHGRYTHCVLDITMPDGLILSLLPVIKRKYPGVRVAIFSMQPPDIYRLPLRQYGVEYYVPKTASDEETQSLLTRFLNNEPFARNGEELDIPENPFSRLSQRELQVLHYILKGYRPTEICIALCKRKQTIATYRTRIFEKTGTTNDRQLCELARAYNLT